MVYYLRYSNVKTEVPKQDEDNKRHEEELPLTAKIKNLDLPALNKTSILRKSYSLLSMAIC